MEQIANKEAISWLILGYGFLFSFQSVKQILQLNENTGWFQSHFYYSNIISVNRNKYYFYLG